jgi:hypothetical protein
MRSSHEPAASSSSALSDLEAFVAARRATSQLVDDLAEFERELRALCAAVETEAMSEELARFDMDVPAVVIDGVEHRKVLRCEETYFGASGTIRVERSLYSSRQDGERAVCPLELRAGLVEGRWTPLAAKQATFVVTHLTPKDGEELFSMLGGMAPSKSSLDRLPKQLGERWEDRRVEFEVASRGEQVVPDGAVTMAVSLDGVMVPMKDGQRKNKRSEALKQGKQAKGPSGYREAGCGTVSFYDVFGDLVKTTRFGRMPEHKKKALKGMLTREVEAALSERPDLDIVKLADGAKDNWTYLSKSLPEGREGVDFYHASEHLSSGLAAAYGENAPRARAQHEKLRRLLKEDVNGVEKVIRSLVHLKKRFPRRKKIADELGYFRRNRHRMAYAALREDGFPIGSGVVEAACKTLVTQRLKRSGMRWSNEGGQAILTFRSLQQSGRFLSAWNTLAQTYKRDVTQPGNVIQFKARAGPERASV